MAFTRLLAEFDAFDMVQLLESALADAQKLSNLGDFYGPPPIQTTTSQTHNPVPTQAQTHHAPTPSSSANFSMRPETAELLASARAKAKAAAGPGKGHQGQAPQNPSKQRFR